MKMLEKFVARAREGFTLVEIMVALILLSVGMFASAGLLGYAGTYRSLSTSRVDLTGLATDKLEELRAYASAGLADTVQLNLGGSLTASQANHADTVTSPYGEQFVRRWVVTNGPAQTRDVTVRVEPLVQSRGQQGRIDMSVLIVK